MKPDLVKVPIAVAPTAVDRLATPDEVLAAVLPFPVNFEDYTTEILNEIARDMGGYERISSLDVETSLLIDEMQLGPNTKPN